MKKLIIMFLFLTGCGLQNQINDLKDRAGTDEGAINDLRNQIGVLEAQSSATVTLLNSAITNISLLQSTVNALQIQLASTATQNEVNNLQSQIDTLTSLLNSAENDPVTGIVALHQQLATNTIAIAVLQGYHNIVDFKDPCNAQGSYNEIFLHLSDGGYIASFSDNASGSNTRFTKVIDGTYSTTDGTHCTFSVKNNGTTIYNEHN